MADAFIGEVRMTAFPFAPSGWALCNGQLLPIAQNTALFSILGTTYGGDGRTSFALPNLQGRVPVHPATSLPEGYVLGQTFGAETVTLLENQISHPHVLNATTSPANTDSPAGALLASAHDGNRGLDVSLYAVGHSPSTTMNAAAVEATGSGVPISVMQPYLVCNYVICLSGIFPSRS